MALPRDSLAVRGDVLQNCLPSSIQCTVSTPFELRATGIVIANVWDI